MYARQQFDPVKLETYLPQGRTEKHTAGLTFKNIYGGGTMKHTGKATERYDGTYVRSHRSLCRGGNQLKKAVFNV